MGWNGDIRRAIVALEKKGREMVFLVPEGTDGVLGRQLGHPDGRRAPGRRAQVDQLRCSSPRRPGREMNYHQYPVPVVEIEGVDPDLAEDPVIDITGRPDRAATSRRSRPPKSLEQRNRAYTEFKAA